MEKTKSKVLLVGVMCVALICITECTNVLYKTHVKAPLLSVWYKVKSSTQRIKNASPIFVIDYVKKAQSNLVTPPKREVDTSTSLKKIQVTTSCQSSNTLM